MDLRRLRLFLAVVDHGSFTAAAKAVHVAQPAVSLAVKDIERQLGAALFVRSREGARLTPAGEALVPPARQALRDIATAAAAVAAVTGLVSGRLDIASLPTLAADPAAQLVGRYRKAHGGVTVHLTAPSDPAHLVDDVVSGAAEVGITEAGAASYGLVEHAIGDQELVAVMPRGATTSKPLTARAFAREALVVTEPGSSLRGALERFLAEAGREPLVAVETEQRDAIAPLVLAGAGAAILPRALAASVAAQGAVVRRLSPSLRRTVVLVHRPSALSPAAARFVDIALAAT
jgi:LysR family transcriptional regulator, carnitine catabolism transcriptional activator